MLWSRHDMTMASPSSPSTSSGLREGGGANSPTQHLRARIHVPHVGDLVPFHEVPSRTLGRVPPQHEGGTRDGEPTQSRPKLWAAVAFMATGKGTCDQPFPWAKARTMATLPVRRKTLVRVKRD